MKVLCISGSRADFGGIEATHKALQNRGIESVLGTVAHVELLKPDLVIILGDRSEILYAAIETYLKKIPIAHLSGGDITEGSQDDSMRHAITKLSHLHFPTNEGSAKRIIQMGEEPWRVHAVGYPGVDNLQVKEHPPAWLTDKLGEYEFILVVWHPNTLVSENEAVEEVKILIEALEKINSNLVVIGPNSDSGSDLIRSYLKTWCNIEDNDYHENLPREEYLWLLKQAKCLVGNSSSGFYEAPSFGTPVVNIGDRQKGRIEPENVFWASISIDDIVHMIKTALIYGRYEPKNPYETGNAADKIAEVISNIKEPKKLLIKRFHDINYTST